MTSGELNPLIHVPSRLKIVATLAALPDGDGLSFTRLQDLIGLTPGNLIIHLRKLEDAAYISSAKASNGTAPSTTVVLTGHGREALGTYTRALRDVLGGLTGDGTDGGGSSSVLDPLIHDPERLRVVATLAALPDGDALSAARLQDLTRLPAGRLVSGLHELGRAGYVRTGKPDGGAAAAVALTRSGRAALDRYTALLGQLTRAPRPGHQAPAPAMRAGDADRDAAAAALGEHFAQGRLTLDELSARLEAVLAATTHGELSRAARDLPGLTGPPARSRVTRRKPAWSRPRPGPAAGRRP